jgi:hypothetical protein
MQRWQVEEDGVGRNYGITDYSSKAILGGGLFIGEKVAGSRLDLGAIIVVATG